MTRENTPARSCGSTRRTRRMRASPSATGSASLRGCDGPPARRPGGSGFAVGEGTAIDALRESATARELDLLTSRFNAQGRANAYKSTGDLEYAKGYSGMVGGIISGAATLIEDGGERNAFGGAAAAAGAAGGEPANGRTLSLAARAKHRRSARRLGRGFRSGGRPRARGRRKRDRHADRQIKEQRATAKRPPPASSSPRLQPRSTRRRSTRARPLRRAARGIPKRSRSWSTNAQPGGARQDQRSPCPPDLHRALRGAQGSGRRPRIWLASRRAGRQAGDRFRQYGNDARQRPSGEPRRDRARDVARHDPRRRRGNDGFGGSSRKAGQGTATQGRGRLGERDAGQGSAHAGRGARSRAAVALSRGERSQHAAIRRPGRDPPPGSRRARRARAPKRPRARRSRPAQQDQRRLHPDRRRMEAMGRARQDLRARRARNGISASPRAAPISTARRGRGRRRNGARASTSSRRRATSAPRSRTSA
jgi:hypothetical protein